MFGNWIKTALLMAAIVALFGTVGKAIGGAWGMLIAILLGGAVSLYAYWYSDHRVLRLYNVREVAGTDSDTLHAMVKELALRAKLPIPRVYLIDEAQPNAFAIGRHPAHAAVVATTGIQRLLTPRELRAVMAHELAHVKNRDTLICSLAATVAGAISALAPIGKFIYARWGNDRPVHPLAQLFLLFFASLAAILIQLVISRAREFVADRDGAEIAGDPEALASALAKLEAYARGTPWLAAQRHPETAQMMIIHPLTGGDLAALFRTHPATEERIRRLLALARRGI